LNATAVAGHDNHNGGRHFLCAMDAIARAVPHTNEAAKRARRDGEAHQHHFGTASYFLTPVTPDDDNSFRVQVYSQLTIDDDQQIAMLSDEQLMARAKQRTQLRLKYPGICAYFFEAVLKIEEVIGWNMTEGKPREDMVGLFGVPQAFTASVEEQGRKTLHTHIQIWVQKFNRWRVPYAGGCAYD
jgi:Helitron helicase-like domain at N-terminus